MYARLGKVSIDYGVMEHAGAVAVVEVRFGWNDVGTWRAMEDVWAADADGNVSRGRFLGMGTSGCVIEAGGTFVATVGVSDLVVVAAGDVVLVCAKERAQDVKKLVQRIAQEPSLKRHL